MSTARSGGRDGGFRRSAAPLRAADLLALAAAPTFAAMALATGVFGGPDMLCAGEAASPLTGMATMYLLMSVFHLAPWLRRLRGDSDQPA